MLRISARRLSTAVPAQLNVVTFPMLSPALKHKGNIAWKCSPGDYVTSGMPILEYASQPVFQVNGGPRRVKRLQQEAPSAGYIAKILVSGDYKSAEAGQPIAILVSDPSEIDSFNDPAPKRLGRKGHSKW